MGKWKHKLPAVLEPDDTISVCVRIPNHPDYVKLFLRAVRMLETNRVYERDSDNGVSTNTVQAQWRERTITPLIQALADGIGCPDESSECLTYPAYAGFIHYFPDNPFDEDLEIPPGYLTHAWWRWGNFESALPDFIDDWIDTQLEEFTGYRNNDAVCWISSLLSLNIPSWIASGYSYPAIEIELEGSGEIEIILVSMPLGGRVFIEVDEQPNIVDIITGGVIDTGLDVLDTNRDWSSFPPEEYPELRYRVAIPEDGDHTVYVMFLPVVNVTISDDALGFGGGLRGVELCGGLRPRGIPEPPPPPPLEGVEELRPEFRFTEDCGMEYQLRDQEDNIVQEWQPVAGWVENAAACFGGGMATMEDIRDGMYEAMNRLAAQIVSGRYTNISIDDDGTVSNPALDVGAELPEDDPDTPTIDESLAAEMGGAVAVAHGLELFFDKLDAYYGATNGTPTSTEAAAQFGIAAYFPTDPGTMDAAITGYYAYRATNNRILFDTSVAFELYLFCNGANEQGFNRWMVDVSGYNFNKQTVVNGLVAGLAEAFFSDYFAIGIQAPSLNYVDALCVKSPTEVIDIVTTGVNYTTLTQWKIGHRLKITVANKWTDPAGIQRDFWYYRTAAGVVSQVFANTSITIGTGVVKPSTTQCPYSSAGDYVFTVEAAATSAMVLNVAAGGVLNAPLTGGPLIVTIEDLGLIS